MASNQVPVAEKARIISDTYIVSDESMQTLLNKAEQDCTEVELFIRKGNRKIPFDMVRAIQKKELKDSTFEELKIRYNDPDLGKFPEWVDMKYVDEIIWKAINYRWENMLYPEYDKDDVYSECWAKLICNTSKIREVGEEDYKRYIFRIVTNRVDHFIEDYTKHLKHFKHGIGNTEEIEQYIASCDTVRRLPEVVYNLNETDKELREKNKSVYITNKKEEQENAILDTIEEELDIIHTIKSIKDETTRDLISIAAYILAGIDSFEGMYQEALARMEEAKRKEFIKMLKEADTKKMNFDTIVKSLAGDSSASYIKKIKRCLMNMTKAGKLAEI